MNKTAIYLLLAAATLASAQSATKPIYCANNCALCSGLFQACYFCYKSNYLADQKTCNPVRNTTNNCDIKELNFRGKCIQCSPGYTRNYKDPTVCAKTTTIPNCRMGVTTEYSNKAGVCQVCENGFYPSDDRTKCVKAGNAVDADPNCLWGQRLSADDKLECLKCKKGYIAVFGKGKCLPIRKGAKGTIGCLRVQDESQDSCWMCDADNGYFMVSAIPAQVCSLVPTRIYESQQSQTPQREVLLE